MISPSSIDTALGVNKSPVSFASVIGRPDSSTYAITE
jgi:hypothetical protein